MNKDHNAHVIDYLWHQFWLEIGWRSCWIKRSAYAEFAS